MVEVVKKEVNANDPEADSLIAEMMDARLPLSVVTIKEVISKNVDNVPVPIVVNALNSAGYAFMYDTRTGLVPLTNKNMLPTQLKKLRPDGSRVFSLRRTPGLERHRGTMTCMLHKDNPERTTYDGLGLPVCPKSNLTNPMMVRSHMEHKHQMEWKIIRYEMEQKEKEADRQFQRELMKRVK